MFLVILISGIVILLYIICECYARYKGYFLKSQIRIRMVNSFYLIQRFLLSPEDCCSAHQPTSPTTDPRNEPDS